MGVPLEVEELNLCSRTMNTCCKTFTLPHIPSPIVLLPTPIVEPPHTPTPPPTAWGGWSGVVGKLKVYEKKGEGEEGEEDKKE